MVDSILSSHLSNLFYSSAATFFFLCPSQSSSSLPLPISLSLPVILLTTPSHLFVPPSHCHFFVPPSHPPNYPLPSLCPSQSSSSLPLAISLSLPVILLTTPCHFFVPPSHPPHYPLPYLCPSQSSSSLPLAISLSLPLIFYPSLSIYFSRFSSQRFVLYTPQKALAPDGQDEPCTQMALNDDPPSH